VPDRRSFLTGGGGGPGRATLFCGVVGDNWRPETGKGTTKGAPSLTAAISFEAGDRDNQNRGLDRHGTRRSLGAARGSARSRCAHNLRTRRSEPFKGAALSRDARQHRGGDRADAMEVFLRTRRSE